MYERVLTSKKGKHQCSRLQAHRQRACLHRCGRCLVLLLRALISWWLNQIRALQLRRLLIDSLITIVCSLPIFSSPFLFLFALAGRLPPHTFLVPISAAPLRAVTLGAHAVLLSHSPCFSAPSHMTLFLSTPPHLSQWSCWTPPRCWENWTGRHILSMG